MLILQGARSQRESKKWKSQARRKTSKIGDYHAFSLPECFPANCSEHIASKNAANVQPRLKIRRGMQFRNKCKKKCERGKAQTVELSFLEKRLLICLSSSSFTER